MYKWVHRDVQGNILHVANIEARTLKEAKRIATKESSRAFVGDSNDREKKNIWLYMDWGTGTDKWVKVCDTKWGYENTYVGHTLTLTPIELAL